MKIRSSVMNSSVSQEFAMFCSHTKQLKRILAETQSCFREINNAANVNGSQLNAAELSELEESELEALVKRPPGIVILGQTAQAKATIVNEILGKEVLPTCTDLKHNVTGTLKGEERHSTRHKWRTIRLKYGRRQRVAFCLTNSFELLGEIDCTEKTWTTVPLEVLVTDKSVPPMKGIREQAQVDGQDDMDSNAHSDGSSDTCQEGVHSDTEQLPDDESQGEDADKYKMSDSHLDSIHQESSQKGLDKHNPATNGDDSCMNGLRPQHEYTKNNISASKDTESQKSVILSEEQHYQACSSDTEKQNVIVEVTLNHPIFSDGAQIIVEDDDDEMTLDMWVDAFITELVPIFVYALSDDVFTKQEIIRLKRLHELLPGIAIFFVKVPQIPCDRMNPPASLKSLRSKLDKYSNTLYSHQCPPMECTSVAHHKAAVITAQSSLKLFQQLLEVGYLNILPGAPPTDQQSRLASDTDSADYYAVESELAENFDNFTVNFIEFVHKVLHCHLVKVIGLLNVVHTRCLQTFILSAFDMARDMLITPKRITFAKEKENELYSSLMTMALQKQDEIRKLIAETVKGKKDELIEKAANYEFVGVEILPTGEVSSSSDLKKCTCQIQDLVLGDLNSAVADKLLGSVDILKDSYTGVLTRCLESLEQSDVENKETLRTSMALKEILTSAYQVEITVRAGASIVKVLLEKMKQLIHSMPWHQAPRIDREWKKQVATNMLNSLSEARLAKSVCRQIKERLKHSHETFSAALKQLEARHSGRLERTEEQRLRVRKVHAPRVARLALESTSFKDLLVFGMPKQGKEIGRGQYGVVHACETWGGFSPCAIKSVVPPDDRHWNDLAMEFFYTKNVPEHDRVVALRGSVIDYSYSGGNPAVLLIMDRLVQDLYNAIKNGLSWPNRLQVAIDVVEGIRYLHSQGLVHRDIKLKNVLLDKHNRGKLTDLGFCKPEAMMSGSIVGTPIHMAPELFSGHYDNSVDTYAFGILFWYVCAGHVHLPYNFEQCTNKEMLWTSVKRGVRPERLPQFDSECWELMQSCWHADPSRRPLLGFVEPKLCSILAKIHKNKSSMKSRKKTTVQQREVSLRGDLS